MDFFRLRLEGAYHELVKVFEDSLKEIYRVALRRKHPEDRARELERKHSASFRQIKSAELAFAKLGVDLLCNLTDQERDVLQLAFAKHYELQGQSDKVDPVYRKRLRPFPRRWRRVALSQHELELASNLVTRIIEQTGSQFGAKW